MKSARRTGLIIAVLLLGMTISRITQGAILLVGTPLVIHWWMKRDSALYEVEKKELTSDGSR